MKNERPSQVERVLKYLKDFGSITQLQALNDLGIMRLASRISEIKRKCGIDIVSEWTKVKNRYGEICDVKCYMFASNIGKAV